MYPGIDLRLQRYAVIVAEELNFSKAAGRLHVAQPALSRAIRQLEDELGVQLFLRTSRKVELTDAGRRFVDEARQALFHAARAVEVTKQPRIPDKLVIAYPAHFDIRFVIELSKLTVPGACILQFIYRSSTTAETLSSLCNRTVDCGIVAMPAEYPEILEFTTVTLFRHQMGITLPKSHPLSRKRNLRLKDVKDESLILAAKEQNPALYAWIEARCRAAGFFPHVAQEARNPHEFAAMVLHGVGVGLGVGLSRTCAGLDLPAGLVLRKFTDPQLAIDTGMMFGDKFNSHPLNGYIAAIAKLRDKYEQGAERRLSA